MTNHHRGHDVASGYTRQSFETHDPEAKFGFRTTYSTFPAGVYSPRHRHNFDQVRFILDGAWEYARKRYGGALRVYLLDERLQLCLRGVEPGTRLINAQTGQVKSAFALN